MEQLQSAGASRRSPARRACFGRARNAQGVGCNTIADVLRLDLTTRGRQAGA
jgi:hypothetical protein